MLNSKDLLSIAVVVGLVLAVFILITSRTERTDSKTTTNPQQATQTNKQEKIITAPFGQLHIAESQLPADAKLPRRTSSGSSLPLLNLEEKRELILDNFEIKEIEQEERKRELKIIEKEKLPIDESKITEGSKQPGLGEKTEGQKGCQRLKQVILNEQEILNEEEQNRISLKYVGRCIKTRLIKALLADISTLYTAKGYITTKAYLVPQNISDGTIELKVIIGFIEEIVFADQITSHWQIKTAFAWMIGEPLNIRELESGLENMSRLPSNNPTFSLLPGKSRGGTKVVIKNKRSSPFRFSFGVTGEGSGEKNQNLTARIEYDNLLNLNDMLAVSYNGSKIQREYQGTNGYEFNYSFPVGSLLFEIVLSATSYKQEVIGLNDTYLSSGNTRSKKLSANKILSRGVRYKLDLKTSITHKETKNYFEEELIDVSSYKTSVGQIDLTHTYNTFASRISSRISYFRGLDWLGARKDRDVLEVDFDKGPKFQFSKYVLDLNYLFYPAKDRTTWSINSNLHVQTSNDILHSANQLIVGNSYTVRGYSRRYLTGNRGWYLKNDLKRGVNVGLSHDYFDAFSLYIGRDAGEILCSKSELDNCGKIDGMAVGLTTSGSVLSSEFTWSKPLTAIGNDFKYPQVFRYSIFFKY